MRLVRLVLLVLCALVPAGAAAAAPAEGAGGTVRGERVWPVGERPPVLRGWEPPASAYGPGHRGVDLAAAAGAPVRAVAAGRVSYAGRVAGRGVLSIELAGTGEPPLRTTYEPVRATVAKGDEVGAGDVVGVLEPGPAHCAPTCLHWGLRRADRYLDPLSLLPPRGPSRLLPVFGVPEPATGRAAARMTPAMPPLRAGPGHHALQAVLLTVTAAWTHHTLRTATGRLTRNRSRVRPWNHVPPSRERRGGPWIPPRP
nr:peptidoglycan DD-metalloendopeptidase family protein [Streptomyces apocyni]